MPARSRTSPENKPAGDTSPSDLLERIARLKAHFGRFLWDILGVFLFAIALLTFLGLLGLSQGSLMKLWVDLLKYSLGWGSIFVVATAVAFGIHAIRRSRHEGRLQWGRVIAFELAAFLTLALLSMLSGNQLTDAEAGMWGGRVGWGLASLMAQALGPIWGGAVIFL